MDRFKLISSCLFVQKKLLKLKNGFFGIPKRYLRSEIKEFLLFDFLSLIERDDEYLILQAKSIASRCFSNDFGTLVISTEQPATNNLCLLALQYAQKFSLSLSLKYDSFAL